MEYVLFNGSASNNGKRFVLTAEGGAGALSVSSEDVRQDGDIFLVRVGAIAKIEKNPAVTAKIKSVEDLKGCRKTACVGFVLYCCDDGRILGPCIGVSGC